MGEFFPLAYFPDAYFPTGYFSPDAGTGQSFADAALVVDGVGSMVATAEAVARPSIVHHGGGGVWIPDRKPKPPEVARRKAYINAALVVDGVGTMVATAEAVRAPRFVDAALKVSGSGFAVMQARADIRAGLLAGGKSHATWRAETRDGQEDYNMNLWLLAA